MSADAIKGEGAVPAGVPPVDAYSEFLNLAAGPRPPHLYQLLELELFCPHREQIEHAVRRQFRKIKPFEEHPDRTMRNRIQDVMTHIATAQITLTDPAQKEEYDSKLARFLKLDREQLIRSRVASRPPEFTLSVTAGPNNVGGKLDLAPDRVVVIGSDPQCTLCLPSTRMKGEHARLEFRNETWWIKATDPSVMVLVNDARATEEPLGQFAQVDLGGYRLRFAPITDRGPDPRSIPPPLSLIVRNGPSVPEPEMSALAPSSVLVGHCETALWQLLGGKVELHHARIEPNGPLWEITDLQTESGTFVNGEKAPKAILQHRDELLIGRFEIQVRLRK
jgi:pSer/pThr/pTyr-binding forkhead associated (FHA) protein